MWKRSRPDPLTAAELPYTNPFGMIYDSGAYHQVMEKALKLGDWPGLVDRRRKACKRGNCRGIRIANYVDTVTGAPRKRAEVTVHPEGRIDVVIGAISNCGRSR